MSKKTTAPPLLNPEQQRVAEHHYGPLRVVACAGSGKTTALIERVVHLVTKQRVPPARILAISFSKNAEKEMSKRLAKRLPDYDISPVARTFHSIGYEVFKTETRDMKTWLMDSSGALYRRALYQAFAAAKIDPCIKVAQRFASRVKNDMLVPPDDAYDAEDMGNEMHDLAAEVAQGSAMSADDLLSVYYMAERYRSEIGIEEGGLTVRFVTFDDMLYQAALLLRQEDVRKRWASRWDFVLQDESQDENEVQAQIAEALCREHRNYMVVGDPAQSVFGFRGARPERILTFDRDWPSAKTVMMHRNYRSGVEVVTAADRLMKEMPDGTVLRFTMSSERQTKAAIDCHAFDDEDLEAKAIAENCAKHSEAIHWKDQAVLVRMNYMTMPIEIALAASGIPYRMVSGTSFFSLRETKILLGYLRVAMGRADAEDLEHALLYPSRFMSRAFVASVAEHHRSTNDWLEAVTKAATRSPSKQSDGAMVWVRFMRALRALCTGQKWTPMEGLSVPMALLGPATPYQALTVVNDVTRMQEWLTRASDNDEENDSLENLARVMSFAAAFHSIPEMLDAVDRIEAHRKAYMRSGDAVTISTCHKSKGLEWKVVYLAGAAEYYFPVAKADRNEERRLFYVAVTRAMDELWISWPESTTDGAGKLEQSSFLREAGLDLTPDPFAPGPRGELGRRGDQMSLI